MHTIRILHSECLSESVQSETTQQCGDDYSKLDEKAVNVLFALTVQYCGFARIWRTGSTSYSQNYTKNNSGETLTTGQRQEGDLYHQT
jgi:hypothetical protein